MNKNSFFLFLLLATLALASGCARVEKEKKSEELQSTLNSYGKSIRWAYFETAYKFIHPDLRKKENMPEGLDNVRVTSYDVAQPPVIKEGDQMKAEQIVKIEYVLRDQQIVRKISDHQHWHFDTETKTWWLHTRMPQFK